MQKKVRILNAFSSIPVYILLSFVWFLLIASLLCRAEYCNYRYFDRPVWVYQDTLLLIITAMLLLFTVTLICIFFQRLDKYGSKQILLLIIYSSVMVQILFLILFPARQFADQEIVNQISFDIIEGNYKAFDRGGYLYQYPNNVGITLFLSLIYKMFPQPLLVPKMLNVVFSTATSYLVFRTFNEVNPEKENKYSILIFSGFFPPMILLNNLVYNDIFATTLFAAAVYCVIKFTKSKRWFLLAISGILLSAGNFFRQIGIVFLLAISIYLLIIKAPAKKTLVFLGIALILFKLPMVLINTYLMQNEKIAEPLGNNSIPIHMWIHMGMNEEKIGYWDDSFSWGIYNDKCGCSKYESIQIYRQLIHEKLKRMGIKNLAKVYIEKNVWLWTEGTYQAEYYGIGAWGYMYSTPLTVKYDNSVYFRDSVRWILHALNILMLSLIFLGLLHSLYKRDYYRLLLPVLILLGFVGFYTLWEIKPRYLYLIYPYLILLAYDGLITFINILKSKIKLLQKI